MALIHCDFFSEALGISTSMYVILPQKSYKQNKSHQPSQSTAFDDKYPTLYLLHGQSDDHTIWLRRTSIERYVANLNLAVVMPAVNRSFYTDMAQGAAYWTFVNEELPEIVQSLFPLSAQREDTFVAGLSMGGYGAFKMALRSPERFAAGASLSGAPDIVRIAMNGSSEHRAIFGEPESVKGSDNDLFHLAERVAASNGPKPLLYQCCGTEDFLYEDNRRFLEHCQKLPLDLTYEEEPGTHEWGYWDRKIQRVLEWLPIRGKNDAII